VEGTVEVCGALLYLRQSAGEHARSQWTCWRTRDNIWTPQIRQLAAIEAGAPIAKPLTREEAINIVTEQIGLSECLSEKILNRLSHL